MERINSADRMAFSRLYEAYAPMVYRRCMALLKDEAEASDLMQDVFLRIYAGMDRLNLDSPIACADDEQEGCEARGILAKIFSREQESTRTIAVLHYVDGMTLEETAEMVGLSVSGVRKRLRTLQARVKNLEVK